MVIFVNMDLFYQKFHVCYIQITTKHNFSPECLQMNRNNNYKERQRKIGNDWNEACEWIYN